MIKTDWHLLLALSEATCHIKSEVPEITVMQQNSSYLHGECSLEGLKAPHVREAFTGHLVEFLLRAECS